MIKGMNHVAFRVVDMEKSLDFYCNKLGFKKAFDMHGPDGQAWNVYVKLPDGRFIELFYDGVEGVRDRANHICFEVDNIHDTADELKKNGVALEVEISQGISKNYQFSILDPDGNWLEFAEMHPDSPHMNC